MLNNPFMRPKEIFIGDTFEKHATKKRKYAKQKIGQ